MSYFRNIENDGIWEPGGTYTFEAYFIADKVQHPLGYSAWEWFYGYYQNYGDGYTLPDPYFTPGYAQEIFNVDDVADGSLAYQNMFEGTYYPSGGETTEIVTQEYIDLPFGNSYTKQYLWKRYTVTIPIDITQGSYKLVWAQYDPSNSLWENNLAGVITASETISITIADSDPINPPVLATWPAARADSYDPDYVWTPDDWTGEVYTPSEWSEPAGVYVVAGGGRWGQSLVVVGKDLIYYESIT